MNLYRRRPHRGSPGASRRIQERRWGDGDFDVAIHIGPNEPDPGMGVGRSEPDTDVLPRVEANPLNRGVAPNGLLSLWLQGPSP